MGLLLERGLKARSYYIDICLYIAEVKWLLPGVSFRGCLGFASEAETALKLLNVLFQNVEAGAAVSELTFGANFNKAGIGQFLQMMRDRCLCDRKPLYDASARQFVRRRRHLFEYLESAGICEGLRNALKLIWIHIS